jgi:hypothetical protein
VLSAPTVVMHYTTACEQGSRRFRFTCRVELTRIRHRFDSGTLYRTHPRLCPMPNGPYPCVPRYGWHWDSTRGRAIRNARVRRLFFQHDARRFTDVVVFRQFWGRSPTFFPTASVGHPRSQSWRREERSLSKRSLHLSTRQELRNPDV